VLVVQVATLRSAIEAGATKVREGSIQELDIEKELSRGRQLLLDYGKQLEVQTILSDALKTKKVADLETALEAADELKLKVRSVGLCRQLLQSQRAEDDGKARGGDEEMNEEERAAKLKEAATDKWIFQNYANLRTPQDFCKGMVLNKKKAKAGMLKHQKTLLHRSLLALETKELNKLALRIHKNVLGYMGDKQWSFPATLAQTILQTALEEPGIADEVYVQIMKQLTENPKAESVTKGWQLLCMCVGTFPPSRHFEKHLLNHVLTHERQVSAIGNYARFALRRLEGILFTGASDFVLSVQEIQAYSERPPILATIKLVDDNIVTEDLPVAPDLTVKKVVEICASESFLDLQTDLSTLCGIFVYEDDLSVDDKGSPTKLSAKDPKPPEPLGNDDFLGDVCVKKARARQHFKLVFKRKIFIGSDLKSTNNDGSGDPVFDNLCYLQAADDVIKGELLYDDEQKIVHMTSQLLAIDFAEEYPDNVAALLEVGLLEYLPQQWRARYSETSWAKKLIAVRDMVVYEPPETLQASYVSTVKEHALFGMCIFPVMKVNDPPTISQFPKSCHIGFDAHGVHIFDKLKPSVPPFTVGYADIYRWGGSSTRFTLVLYDSKIMKTYDVNLATEHSPCMATMIMGYIDAIMMAR
jgi:hypothetical protein